jgi:uncharacterized LabA/DUF88 family protein
VLRPQFAILVDGGFLTRKLQQKLKRFPSVEDVYQELTDLTSLPAIAGYELLRIYWYDAYPSSDTLRRPVSGTEYRLATTDRFRNAQSLFDQLVLKPHMALRMGEVIVAPGRWRLKTGLASKLIQNPRDLTDDDFELDIAQKGVDMRVGMDMARLALRELVRAIVVVTGDADFVPAFKFVRREGVKVVLVTLDHHVRVELKQHSDIVY